MDYLVNLYALSASAEIDAKMRAGGVTVRRALSPEYEIICDWIREHFGSGWSGETAIAFMRQPISCFIALKNKNLQGFAVYDSTSRGFFGPTGVDEKARGSGIGHALLLATLLDMRNVGHSYAVIGDIGPAEFYVNAVGAIPIPGSEQGLYADLLKPASK